jgi:hypothetical protein
MTSISTQQKNTPINFINNTDTKVVLENWYRDGGMDSYSEIEVEPNQTLTSKSITNEWRVRYSYDTCPKKCGALYLGKFTIDTCMSGEFIWMETDDFNITRDSSVIFSIERTPRKMG